MPTTCASSPEGSTRKTTVAVRTAFRCVASRNRDRKKETLAKKKQPSSAEQHPAPGLRAYQYGTLYYVGSHGFSWSSTASGGSVHYLELNYARIIPQDLGYRAYGFPLRCLQK